MMSLRVQSTRWALPRPIVAVAAAICMFTSVWFLWIHNFNSVVCKMYVSEAARVTAERQEWIAMQVSIALALYASITGLRLRARVDRVILRWAVSLGAPFMVLLGAWMLVRWTETVSRRGLGDHLWGAAVALIIPIAVVVCGVGATQYVWRLHRERVDDTPR